MEEFQGLWKTNYAQKLNELRRYIPFVNYMVSQIRKNIRQYSVAQQFEKYRLIRTLLAEKQCPANWNLVVSVEDVIRRLQFKVNFEDESDALTPRGLIPSGETEGNDSQVRPASTWTDKAATSGSFQPVGTCTVRAAQLYNSGPASVTSRISTRRTRTSTVTLASMPDDSDSSRTANDSNARNAEVENASEGTSGDNGEQTTRVNDTQISLSSRGMLEQSRPSTSRQPFSQSLTSHTNINKYFGFITYMGPMTECESEERPQVCEPSREETESAREEGRLNPDKDNRREETIPTSEDPSDSFSLSDILFRTELSDNSSEAMEGTSQESSRPNGDREEERMTSVASERDERPSTSSGEMGNLSQNRENKSSDEKAMDKGKRRKIFFSSLNDDELFKFVRDNIQALPHLAQLKPTEIREALRSLGIESYEEASSSLAEDESANKFSPSRQSLLETLKSKVPRTESSVLHAEGTSSIEQREEGDNVVEASEDVSASRSDESNPEVARSSGYKGFTRDTFDVFTPDIQPHRNAESSQLPLPETDKPHVETPQIEPDRISMPSEESGVKKADRVKPSENMRTRMSLRRHSSHSTPVQSTTSYRTKDIVYDNWLASALPSTINRERSAKTQKWPAESSSQSHPGVLNPMGSTDIRQTVSNPKFQQPELFSPSSEKTKPENLGKIRNSSQLAEATSYAEYKRLKLKEKGKLSRKSTSPVVMPSTSSESGDGGRLAGEENIPKKGQVIESPQLKKHNRKGSPRGQKESTGPKERRRSDRIDSKLRLRENPNERAKKDENRRKKADSEKRSADPEEKITSPLEKLYESEPKLQTGRGYGLQHFKIPKKVQRDASDDRKSKPLTEGRGDRKKVEVWGHTEESTNFSEHGGSSSRKGDGSHDPSEQTPNKSHSDKDMGQRAQHRTHSEKTTNKNKDKKSTGEESIRKRDSSQQTRSRPQTNRKGSRKTRSREIPEHTEDSNKESRNAAHHLEQKKEKVATAKVESEVCKGTATTTKKKKGAGATAGGDDRNIIDESVKTTEVTETMRREDDSLVGTDSRETITNTKDGKSNIISHVEEEANPCEAIETTRRENENTRGNLKSRGTIANTEEYDRDEDHGVGLDDFEQGTESTTEEKNGVGSEHPVAYHQKLANLNDQDIIEREESSNSNSNDVETTKMRESPVAECDPSVETPLGETSSSGQEEQELKNTNPVVPEESATGEKMESIERQPLDGSAEENNVGVTANNNDSENEKQKSSRSETKKDETKGNAAKKEMVTRRRTKKGDTSSHSLASSSNKEESEQPDSSATDAKKKDQRTRRSPVGADVIPLKKSMRMRRKRGRKQLATSGSTEPEGADTGNLESEPAQEPETKRKRKGKAKSELDRLHDDIRSMFISSDVVRATGQRTCRMLRESANNTNNSEIETNNAKAVEEGLRSKGDQESSQGTSRRNADNNDAGPSDTVTRETDPKAVIDESHSFSRWPRVVLHRMDFNNFGYGTKSAEDCITFSRKKGSNKAIRSHKNWISQPSTSSIKSEDDLRNTESKKSKEKSTKKSSRGKKETRTEKSTAEGIDQTKDLEACQKRGKKKDKKTSQRNKSQVKVSKAGKEKMSKRQEDDSLLNYSYQKSQEEYKCKICSKVSSHITFHYKRVHPESEVLISRLNKKEAAKARREAEETDSEDRFIENISLDRVRNILSDRTRKSPEYWCRMCERPVVTDVNSFFSHMSRHTGEYRFKCPVKSCGLTGFSRGSVKRHIGMRHCDGKKEWKGEVITLFPVPEELGHLFGYMCSRCNFVQILRTNLEKHIKRQHGGNKNIVIIKINLSSDGPPRKMGRTASGPPIVRRVITYVHPTEREMLDEDNTEYIGHGEGIEGQMSRLLPIKLNMISKKEKDVELDDDANGKEEVGSESPLQYEELQSQIEVEDSSYMFKPESISEPELEASFDGNLVSKMEMGLDTDWKTLIEEDYEMNQEGDQETYPTTYLEADSEPIFDTHLQGDSDSNAEQHPLTDYESDLGMNLVKEPKDADERADLSGMTSMKISDITNPLESSDSLDGESPSTSRPRPERSVERIVVGPLEAQLLGKANILYECFTKGCVCKTTSYSIFEQHIRISHSETKWNGQCEICRAKGKDQRPVYFDLEIALKHLELHARQIVCQEEMRRTEKRLLASSDSVPRADLKEAGKGDSIYPRKPLLRVRNLVGDRLSTPKEPTQKTTEQDSIVSIFGEEPTPSSFIRQDTDEEGFIKIQDVRSLNPEEVSGSEMEFEEFVSPMGTDEEQVVVRQPVVVRSCPTRQITIQPDTSVLPIELGHSQAVQAPVSRSSVVVSPPTDSNPVDSGSMVLGEVPNTVPIRTRSSMRPQTQTTKFASQSVIVSRQPSVQSPTRIVSPIPTPTTSSQAVIPSSIVMEPESEDSTSSSDPDATVEQPVDQSFEDSVEISTPQAQKVTKRRSFASIIKGPTVPPSLPGEASVESSSLQMRSVLPFGNKTVKVHEIYESMLTKEKLCDLFKCMATECSFTCNNQATFDQHIRTHEAEKKAKESMFLRKGKKVYAWQQCSYCCETVANPASTLSQHILNVHGHCTYQCAYCFFRAICVSYVNVHQSLAHLDRAQVIPRIIYNCKQLSSEPIYPEGWQKLSKRKFVRPYECEVCGKKYIMTQEFLDHLNSEHSSTHVYTCHICKNLCFKAERLVTHYKLHSYSVYQCCFCLHATEIEWEMVVHLCQFHFTQHSCAYARIRIENSSIQENWDADLENLKVVTYDEDVSSNCIVESWDNEEDDRDDDDDDDDDEDDNGNLVINESQESSNSTATGIRIEGESSSPDAIMQELTSLVKENPPDAPLDIMWPNARFSSEGESGSETVVISSGQSMPYGEKSTAPKPAENYNIDIPLEQSPLKTSSHQIPVISQSVIVPRFDDNFDETVQKGSMVSEAMETPEATTSSQNVIIEPEIVTSDLNPPPLPPATHKLPPIVLTTKSGAVRIRRPTESLTAPTLKTRQVEEKPHASSHEAEVSCEQEPGMDSFQQESNINVDSNTMRTPGVDNVPCSLTPSLQGSADEYNIVDVKRSSDETGQEAQNPTQEETNEDDAGQDNQAEASEGNDLERNTGEEASTSTASITTNLPRTRFSALRPLYRRESSSKRLGRDKSAGTKKKDTDLTGESLWLCGNTGCNFAAPDERQLLDHLAVCENTPSTTLLTCPHCKKQFKQNITYLEHLKVHGERKFLCGICQYKAVYESVMIRHAKNKHRSKQLKAYPTEPPKEGYMVYYPKSYKGGRHGFKEDGYSPEDVDKLPLQSIYQVNVKCAECPYYTKVRSNMVRHLKIHVKSTETEGVIVPSTAPTNPVPCLDAKEKMFDKMTNLAASSQLAQAKEKTVLEELTPDEIDKLPQFINEQVRYKCSLSDCKYITVNESILKHHIKILHAEETHYSCPHCNDTIRADVRNVTLDKVGFHLRHHDSRLYKCAHCVYFHYQRAMVEKHTLEKHPDRRYFIHTVREPSLEDGSTTGDSRVTVWKCGLCKDFQSLNRPNVVHHLTKIHGTKSLYKCQLCDMKTNLCQLFDSHYSSKHPGENVSFITTIIKERLSGPGSAALAESTTDHFDTTPLWQRRASGVRHIRGILIEEDEEEKKTKKSKKTVRQTEDASTSAPSTSSASPPPPYPAPEPASTTTTTTTTTTATIVSPARGPTPGTAPTSTPLKSPIQSQAPTSSRAPPSTQPKTPTPSQAPTSVRAPPIPSKAPSQSQAPTPAPAPTSVPVRAPILIRTPTLITTTVRGPILAKAPTLIPTQTPITTPIRAVTPVRTVTPVQAASQTVIVLTSQPRVPTSTVTSAPVRPPVSTPTQTLILFPAPGQTSTSTPAQAPISTSAQAPIPTPAPTSAPTQAQIPAPARALTSVRAWTPARVPAPTRAPTQVLTSRSFPAPVPARAPAPVPGTSAATSEAQASGSLEKMVVFPRPYFEQSARRLPSTQATASESNKTVLVIQQEQSNIERKRQARERCDDEPETRPDSPKMRKTTD